MNKVILVGRLARDPELKTTATGKSVCTFSVAVDRRYKQEGGPTADFFNVTAWGKQGEVVAQYLKKGRQIALNGRLQTRSYTGQDGTKRYATDIVLEEFDFIGSKGDNEGGYSSSNKNYSEPASNSLSLDDFDSDFHMLSEDDDVPF